MQRGGRGGHGGSGKARFHGVDMPFEMDPNIKLENKPEDLFPDYKPKPSVPPLRFESLAVARYRSLRSRIHEGPLYTVLGSTSRITKSSSNSNSKIGINPSAALFDPFEATPTYTQKYIKPRNRIPRLDTRPYVIELFPKELWAVLGVKEDGTEDKGRKGRQKKLQIARLNRLSRLEQLEANGELDVEEEPEEEEEESNEQEERSREFGEEEVDEDDDEDENDDYNAEQYFDDGEADDYDDGGAGEDFYE